LFASAWAVPRNAAHRKLAVTLAAYLAGGDAQRTRLEAGLELATMPAVQASWLARDTLGLDEAFARQVTFGRAPWGARIAKFREVEAQLPEMLDEVLVKGRAPADVARETALRLDRILLR
jgi:hypothetical protein